MMTNRLAHYLPARARRIVYMILATLAALETVWDVLDTGTESRLLATATVLGFGLAASQTHDR